MTWLSTRLATALGGHRLRHRVAAGRLRTAHGRFDVSMIVLRKAAFDHIDCQCLLSLALRATLARLTSRAGPHP